MPDSPWLDFGGEEKKRTEAAAAERALAADVARAAGRAGSATTEKAKATAVDPSAIMAKAESDRLAKAREAALGESASTARLAELAKARETGAGGVPVGTAAELIDAARFAGRAATSGDAITGATQSDKAAAADAARLQAQAEASGVKAPPGVVKGATEIAAASPSRVGQVLDKLKAEEAAGGPDFWDVIQAAAAGWGGQVPLYVQKEIARKEAETQSAATDTAMQREAAIRAEEMGKSQTFEREMAQAELVNRLKLAGLATRGGGVGSLSLDEFMGAK
jgi:hypothetical protein